MVYTLEINLTMGFLGVIFFLIFIADRFIQNENVDIKKSEFLKIVGVLFYFFSLLILSMMLFVMMESSAVETFYPVMRALFIISIVVFGLVSSVGTLITFFIAFLLGLKAFFIKDKNEKKSYYRS